MGTEASLLDQEAPGRGGGCVWRTQAMKRMGIRLGGCEEPLEKLIRDHVAFIAQEPTYPYTLIEIGSAGCVTLRAFRDILHESGITNWRAVGFDLTLDKAWSVNMDEVRQSFAGVMGSIVPEPDSISLSHTEHMYLTLLDDPRTYLRDSFHLPIDFAFIDASHGKSAGYDFLAIESKVTHGGLVVFHDYGEPEQGTDWQTHDREFISVRSYVHRLGLASPCNTPRKGWRFVGEIKGSRHWGGDGNSAAVVQRTSEPLVEQPELSLD